jgi:SAM-dependent methyltransferase
VSLSHPVSLAREFVRRHVVHPLRRVRRLTHAAGASLFDHRRFECPICSYRGMFVTLSDAIIPRRYALCPRCGSRERDRLHAEVLHKILPGVARAGTVAIHVAPESPLVDLIRTAFGVYATCDLMASNVDFAADLRRMPLRDDSVDFVFASHVLDVIPNGRTAIAEIHRILKPGGVAVLSVAILCEATVEYPHVVRTEGWRVLAPGRDYFARYEEWFRSVTLYTSADFSEAHQLYLHEDRTVFPNEAAPYRPPMPGSRHLEYVPVCIK